MMLVSAESLEQPAGCNSSVIVLAAVDIYLSHLHHVIAC
jgi:hypothetical protein